MFRRLIAIFLALWLPLQLGTAFALSAPMQAAGGHRTACAEGAQAGHDAHRGHVGLANHGSRAGHVPDAVHDAHAGHGAHADYRVGPPDSHAACSPADAHDAASCIDCVFCFASSIALGVAATATPGAEASHAAVASRADRFASLTQVPPDPPPIA